MAKFSGFRTFKIGNKIEEVVSYLNTNLMLSLKELQTGLSNLALDENFKSQTITVEIGVGLTKGYSHSLGVIPSKRLIVRHSGGLIDDASPTVNPWTSETVYFRNTGSTTATATIILMR